MNFEDWKEKMQNNQQKQNTRSQTKPKNTQIKKQFANFGWLFYKGYFLDFTKDDYEDMLNETFTKSIKDKTDKIFDANFKLNTSPSPIKNIANQTFKLTTTYPGLLVGSGYMHELPNVKEQIQLGFDFDYTTGLPIIRGSSIKGALRSAFKHKEYIKEILDKDIDVKKLEESIFENSDIFFDAVVFKVKDKLLGDDYVTPHKDELKNPIPIRFLKVLPEVTFEFYFRLDDGDSVTKEDKANLFKEILLDLGVGAKTNIGYGKFKRSEKS